VQAFNNNPLVLVLSEQELETFVQWAKYIMTS